MTHGMAETQTRPMDSAMRDAMVDEARRIVDAARERGVVLRLYGGLAVRAHCDVIAFCERDYSDVDMIGLRAQRKDIVLLFRALGFTENYHFSQATRGRQLQFVRPCRHGDDGVLAHDGDHIDVSLDTFKMDHEIDLKDRLQLDDLTIPVSDQLLTKLQVFRPDEKDARDVLTLLKGLELAEDEAPGVIGLSYVAARCADDWGLHHDVERSLQHCAAVLPSYGLADEDERRVRDGLARVRRAIEGAPKSLRWKLRAKVGERRPWHNDVEEQGEDL
jgi:hypothetical protein